MLHFTTHCLSKLGETLYICYNGKKLPMLYTHNFLWQANIKSNEGVDTYWYELEDDKGEVVQKLEIPRKFSKSAETSHLWLTDYFYPTHDYRAFRTIPFINTIFNSKEKKTPLDTIASRAVQFIVEAPFVLPNQGVGIIGNHKLLGEWNVSNFIPMSPTDFPYWHITFAAKNSVLNLVEYKFVIYDKDTKKIVKWEDGENRWLTTTPSPNASIQVRAHFRTSEQWHGSGVAIPVFSLRSERSFGVGEFEDLKLMADWAAKTNQSIIQILPINDTTYTLTNKDSYPYSANSINALHPIYLSIESIAAFKDKATAEQYNRERLELNSSATVRYEEVINLKHKYISIIFEQEKDSTFESKEYKKFFKDNKEWLVPYAQFRVESAGGFSHGIEEVYFTQFHLFSQIIKTKSYCNKKGVVLKGDLPIGISRNSVDAITNPELFNLDKQAGAPPDDFAVLGQNWGFPTYNWEKMKEDGYKWWINRFENMSKLFDAYRIDHILGFFRIWEIPTDSTCGLLGYFNPCMPLNEESISQFGVNFNESMSRPYITIDSLREVGCNDIEYIKNRYFNQLENGRFEFKENYATQRKLTDNIDEKDSIYLDNLLKLHTDVLFVEIFDKGELLGYQPRISVWNSKAIELLSDNEKMALYKMHEQYFYHSHNDFWKKTAMEKLPTLIKSTNMLVCGEDLGMVPDCVPETMKQLQVLSLEIQRMPKAMGESFVNPARTPYLSVNSVGTHDTSTLRQWWKEDREKIAEYCRTFLGINDIHSMPEELTAELAKKILEMHYNGNSMWVIMPWQDIMAISDKLRAEDADSERINRPDNPNHFWCYRMHITLEQLLKENDFNNEVALMAKRY